MFVRLSKRIRRKEVCVYVCMHTLQAIENYLLGIQWCTGMRKRQT